MGVEHLIEDQGWIVTRADGTEMVTTNAEFLTKYQSK
jgi:hypothetical protein